ncbi:centromere-associated protein E-like isoform X1 [Phthorimaea operculella]|nr:centromere-associated protein E-like isoform X1 [Phthorimaea operculella]
MGKPLWLGVNVSQLNLVDLAGSERAGQTGATGLRFKEGTHINKSLSSLALVIKQLSEDPNKYANYRDSKLTRILQNSLGGNAKTSIICAITPASVEETISTLQFANRAKSIKNKPEVNAVATNATMIQSLTKQLSKLQSELAAKRNLEVMLQSSKNVEQELQNRINTLQKMILNGFGQFSTMEYRRKPAQPRRMTISTLHHIEQDPPVKSSIPKFCTPSLKYNPLNIPGAMDFTPLHPGGTKLATVHEEARAVTPPPTGGQPDKKVNFQDEVIEINSDDDSITEPRCSPYHKCYGATKTPPCVLRKNAKQAEKNLKDIVELTEREKMYTPSVVELMEKLEHNTTVITQLQEKVDSLTELTKEKDAKIEELTSKVNSTESLVNEISSAKSDLEVQCKEKETKLTDFEVSYETLLKKSKTREQELLSLLEEQSRTSSRESIGKPKSKESEILNFLDMSRDMTLVHSDTDCSTVDDGATHLHDLVRNIQAELDTKTNTIIALEADIYKQKQQIETLQTSSQKLQSTIDEFKTKFADIETENSYLKCTIDNLNATIENQKITLATADRDIESYNSTIQELQIQLNKKEPIVIANDSVIESMIANEQKCIANNDNIRNIIHSLKTHIENKTREIEELKLTVADNREKSGSQESLKEQLEIKESRILSLVEEAESLKQQVKRNVDEINKLLATEKDLTSRLNTMQEENKSLQQQNTENSQKIETLQKIATESDSQMEKLQTELESLTSEITKKQKQEQDIITKNEELSKQVQNMTNLINDLNNDLSEKILENEQLSQTVQANKNMLDENQELTSNVKDMIKRINGLERDLQEKDKVIALVKDRENEIQSNLSKAKTILFKIQDIALKLKGVREEIPDYIEDIGEVLEIINTRVIHIDDSATQSLQTISELEERCSSISSQYNVFKAEEEQLNHQLTVETETLTQKTFYLIENLNKTHAELENKQKEITNIQVKLDNALSICKDVEQKSQEHLNKSYSILLKLHNIASKLNRGIETLPDSVENYDVLFELFDGKLNVLDSYVVHILKIANDMQEKLMEITNDKETDIANFESQIERINSDMAIQTQQVSQRTLHLIEELKKCRVEIEAKEQKILALEIELNEAQETNKNLRNDVISKDNSITSLNEKLDSLHTEMETLRNMNMNVEKLEETLKEKYIQIKHLEDQLANGVDSLEDKYKQAITKRDMLLAEILKKAGRVARQCGVDNSEIGETYDDDVYERVVVVLDKIGMSVALLKTENDVERSDIEKMMVVAKDEIEKLTAINVRLTNDNEVIRNTNTELLLELEETKKLNNDLSGSKEVLEQQNLELQSKCDAITSMGGKVIDVRGEIVENNKLKKIQKRDSFLVEFSENLSTPISDLVEKPIASNSPQSLLTICCNKIADAMQHQTVDSAGTTSSANTTLGSKISIITDNAQTQTENCNCENFALKLCQTVQENSKLASKLSQAAHDNAKLLEDLAKATQENVEVMDLLKDLRATNEYLLKEREEVKEEIKLLVEPAIELQKKIVNHRTNLSTLTATTYAENKLLNSQLKVLKHHHTRYIHVCQRDLPAFKSQLSELMTLLKESTFNDKQNTSFKRYSLPDVLDNSNTTSAFKNESTLDGDLLMMDTNLTLTTVDNTLVGPDQTCLEMTQVNFDANETTCQANDISKIIDPYILYSQMESLTTDNQKLSEQIEALQQENSKLKDEVLTISRSTKSYKDAESSPIKTNGVCNNIPEDVKEHPACKSCIQFKDEISSLKNTFSSEMEQLNTQLERTKSEKDSIQKKFDNLALEVPSTESLLRKLKNLEKDNVVKSQEISKLTNEISKKNKILKELQDENDTLSMQVMDNISEADALKKESDELKETNQELIEKIKSLELLAKEFEEKSNNGNICSYCTIKDEMIKSLQLEHSKLARSLSDSDSSSRHNKIFTLQHELHASKEDCQKITEEVATIKNHLERSNVSVCQAMDLDESMGGSSFYTMSNDLSGRKNSEDQTLNAYTNDKLECINYYVDIIGSENEKLDDNVKIIDIMKAFYKNLVAKHGDELDNLLNRLKDFEESKTQLQTQVCGVNTEHSKVTEALHESQSKIKMVTDVVDRMKNNINLINQEMCNITEVDKNSKLVTLFKDNLLTILDSEFSLSCVNIFETLIDSIVNKHQKDLSDIMEQYSKLQNHMEDVVKELNSVNENLTEMKSQLSDKENEYNLLKAQKEKVHEISNAVTLDIIKKEQELKGMLYNGYTKLLELNLIDSYSIEPALPLTENMRILFESVINKNKSTKTDTNADNLILEINKLKATLDEKENIVSNLQDKLTKTEKDLQDQKLLHEEIYETKMKEYKTHIETIEQLTNEVTALREEINEKENYYMEIEMGHSHSGKSNSTKGCESCNEILTKLECCRQDYENLKTLHDMVTKEKETCAVELEKAKEIISKNKVELENMTSDILVLQESVNDNVSLIQELRLEAKSMMEKNNLLKIQFENKSLEVSRLEMNIKTHEKTAQIQSKMITRLQKQKEDDDNLAKVSGLEMDLMQDGHKRRQSIDAIAEGARRRRQSLHDTRRAFVEDFDANKIEEVFESRAKPDDLFMDIDENNSSRSTPSRLSRGRDSLLRNDDEDNSRPSSVNQTRRRRQSIHDQRRSMTQRTPSPNIRESRNRISAGDNQDVLQLRESLSTTQRELEELKEKYRELDEECETCAQYLQERDEQCRKLRKEKLTLEQQVTELNKKLKSNPNQSAIMPKVVNTGVNTDEDWVNLHSVVVDRMSYDAEVEKNKRLSRTIEELRCNKQELKNTIGKMQKALEKNAAYMHSKELDAAKAELASCKRELADLQEKYRELDEECETCAQYLRERDEQCRKLKEAKHALERKLEELQSDTSRENITLSARRKRQSVHDQNRSPQTSHARADKQTETSDDFLSYQVERDDEALKATNSHIQELQRVKMTLERVLREKAVLENQLTAMPAVNPTLYVATGSGIVQNQQLTDIMKENQKLKRMNAKLVSYCKKRGKSAARSQDCENEEPSSDLG